MTHKYIIPDLEKQDIVILKNLAEKRLSELDNIDDAEEYLRLIKLIEQFNKPLNEE